MKHYLTDAKIAEQWPDKDNPEGRAEIRRQWDEAMKAGFIDAEFLSLPVKPTDAMVAAGVQHALNSRISADNPWPDYIRSLWSVMVKEHVAEVTR